MRLERNDREGPQRASRLSAKPGVLLKEISPHSGSRTVSPFVASMAQDRPSEVNIPALDPRTSKGKKKKKKQKKTKTRLAFTPAFFLRRMRKKVRQRTIHPRHTRSTQLILGKSKLRTFAKISETNGRYNFAASEGGSRSKDGHPMSDGSGRVPIAGS